MAYLSDEFEEAILEDDEECESPGAIEIGVPLCREAEIEKWKVHSLERVRRDRCYL